MPTKIENIFLDLAKKVHAGKLAPGQIDKAVSSFVANSLLKGVYNGFENDFKGVDYDTPDYKMLSHLEQNVYYFSCGKQFHEVIELNEALRDGERVLTFQEFKEKAFAINEKYNANYLQAEYNHAVASSQMARRWVDIQEAKETHPFLRYDTVGDDRVRQAHRELEGVTKPIDDSFWDTWYPPNGWNCRCDVQQVQDGKVTPSEKINTPTDVPDMFKTNTAKLGMVYPPKHPYWALAKGTAEELKKQAERIRYKVQEKECRTRLVNKVEVKRKELSTPIQFTSNGIKEAFNQPHPFKASKNASIRKMDEILNKAHYEGFKEDYKKNPMVKWIHVFSYQVEEQKTYCVVRELITGECQFYSVSDGENMLLNLTKKKKR